MHANLRQQLWVPSLGPDHIVSLIPTRIQNYEHGVHTISSAHCFTKARIIPKARITAIT
jgi:hypothetical protein